MCACVHVHVRAQARSALTAKGGGGGGSAKGGGGGGGGELDGELGGNGAAKRVSEGGGGGGGDGESTGGDVQQATPIQLRLLRKDGTYRSLVIPMHPVLGPSTCSMIGAVPRLQVGYQVEGTTLGNRPTPAPLACPRSQAPRGCEPRGCEPRG